MQSGFWNSSKGFGLCIFCFGIGTLGFGFWILDFKIRPWDFGLGLRILGFGLCFLDLGVGDSNLEIWPLDFRLWILDFGSGAWTLGFELWAFNLRFWILGFGFWVLDFSFWNSYQGFRLMHQAFSGEANRAVEVLYNYNDIVPAFHGICGHQHYWTWWVIVVLYRNLEIWNQKKTKEMRKKYHYQDEHPLCP